MKQQFLSCFTIVFRWRAPDMPDHYFHFFTEEYQLFRVDTSYIITVNISIYAPQKHATVLNRGILWFFQFLSYFYSSEITGMPYLITVFKMFEDCIIQITMGIRNKTNANHGRIVNLNAI